VLALYPSLPNARWVALRLLDGDEDIIKSLRSGDLGELIPVQALEERQIPDQQPAEVEHAG